MAKLLFLSLAVVFLAGSIFAEDRKTPDVPTKNPSILSGYDVDPKDEPANNRPSSYDVEDPSDLDEQAMSADLELDEDDMDDKQPTSYDLDTEQDEKIRDIRRTLDKLEKKNSSSKTDSNDTDSNDNESNDNESNDTDRNAEEEDETSDDANANDSSMTPAERAFIRRVTRTRRVYFPYRYFDANNEDQEGDNMMQGNSMMEGSDNRISGSMDGNMPMDPSMMNNMNQQSMMGQGQQDGVVLRIPKRILKKLIRKFGRNGSRKMRRHHRRSSKDGSKHGSKHGSGLRLVRLVPILLQMSSGMDESV